MGPDRFPAYLASRRPLVEDWMAAHAWEPLAGEAAAADMDVYLYGPLARFNAGGGKRIRPVLALLGCEAVGGDPARALAAGCAIELFQSAALVHDDIADEGVLRRGEPCLHRTLGVGLAINVGDGALLQATDAILSDPALDDACRLRILHQLVDMERRTVEGQALDLGWVRDDRWDVTVDDYLVMARHKTAFYSAATPLQMGATCGGGTSEQVAALVGFGLEAGLAFQLADDLLNLVGDAQAQGKDFRSDITEGKRTMIVTRALDVLEGRDRDELIGLLRGHFSDQPRLERAVSIMRDCGAIGYVADFAEAAIGSAVGQLDSVNLEADARATLASMAHFFIERAN